MQGPAALPSFIQGLAVFFVKDQIVNSCLENPHGQRSLVGYSTWGRKESDTTEQLCLAAGSKYFRLWATYSLCCILFFLNNALKM